MCATPSRGMITKGAIQLTKVMSDAVIDHQIKTILDFDKLADICFVLGFESDRIQNYISSKGYNVRTVINHNFGVTSQVDSLRLGINSCLVNDTFIIHGDMLFNKEALETCSGSHSGVLKASNPDKTKIGIASQNGELLTLSYGLPETWSQILYLTKKDFAATKSIINSFRKNKLTYEFINMINKNTPLKTFSSKRVQTKEINKKYENSNYNE